MLLRILPLLIVLLGLACVQRQEPVPSGSPVAVETTGAPVPGAPPPPPGPGGPGAPPPPGAPQPPGGPVAQQGEQPYQILRQAELWEFRPDGVAYDFSACVKVLKPGQEAVAMSSNPVWKGERTTGARWAGDMELALLDPVPYPGNKPEYETLLAVVKPVKPAKKGDFLKARYRLQYRDAPYLHRTPGTHRLLSLTIPPRKGTDRQNLLFAFPENEFAVLPTDTQPTQVMKVPGWRVYRYEISKVTFAVIHLGFELTAVKQPLAPLEELLPPAEQVTCP